MGSLMLWTLLVAPAPAPAAERLVCREEHALAAANLCLAKCYEEDDYYDVLGGAVGRTAAHWRECQIAAESYCEIYDYELEDVCWGAAEPRQGR